MPLLITDLNQIKQLADEHHDDFEVLRYMLEADDDIDDSILDRIIEGIAAPIVAAIDCKKCANCCRSLDVYLTEQDAQRLAKGLTLAIDETITKYIDRESAARVQEWGKFRACPCVFLKGNLCSVYPHRPESCCTYPAFTPDFRWTLADNIAGASLCPIIYNVLTAILAQVDEIMISAQE